MKKMAAQVNLCLFLNVFCLACNTVCENWLIWVNTGLAYFYSLGQKPNYYPLCSCRLSWGVGRPQTGSPIQTRPYATPARFSIIFPFCSQTRFLLISRECKCSQLSQWRRNACSFHFPQNILSVCFRNLRIQRQKPRTSIRFNPHHPLK